MKRAILLGLFATLVTGGACLAGEGPENGTFWNGIDAKWGAAGRAVKRSYLFGALDAFHFMVDRAEKPEGAPVFPKKDVGSFISGLDRLYGDPKNVKIPVVYALSIVNMQLSGVDSQEVETIIKEKRGYWDGPPAEETQ